MRLRFTLAGLAVVCALLGSAPVRADQDGWVSYEDEGGCIGGAKCGENGWQLRIRLEDSPITEVRFHAHDDVGDKSNGHLRVRIDDHVLARDIDVPKDGDDFELDAGRARGRRLVFEALSDDEVVIEDIEVQYGRRR